MKKYFISSIIAIVLILGVGAQAQAVSLSDLRAKIADLTAMLDLLEKGSKETRKPEVGIRTVTLPSITFEKVSYDPTTGVLDIAWNASGAFGEKVLGIDLIRKDNPKAFEVNLSQGYCEVLGGCIKVASKNASFNLKEYTRTYSGKPIDGEYTLRLECLNRDGDKNQCPSGSFVTETIRISGLSALPEVSKSSHIKAETRVETEETALYGLKYSLSGKPITVQRYDFNIKNTSNTRPITDFVDTIQLLDTNGVVVSTIRALDFVKINDTVSLARFTGLNIKLQDGDALYVRVNKKSNITGKVQLEVSSPKNGIRYTDPAKVSQIGGAGQAKAKVTISSDAK